MKKPCFLERIRILDGWGDRGPCAHEKRLSWVRLRGRIQAGQVKGAYALVAPVLAEGTPFILLGRIGRATWVCPQEILDAFLEHVASAKTEGGWVIIGCSLEASLSRDLEWAFARTDAFLVQADVWYATDILAERVPGPALVMDFPRALSLIRPWRETPAGGSGERQASPFITGRNARGG